MSAPSFRNVLRERNFSLLWSGQVISSIGDRLYQLALVKIALDLGHRTAVGMEGARLTFFGLLPGLLLAPWLGWVVDRYSRRQVMIFSDLVRAALALSFILCVGTQRPEWAVYLLVLAMGAASSLFIPARQAILPQLVRPQDLVTANALISLVGIIAHLFGALGGGLLIAVFGTTSSFVLNSAGFIVSACLIASILPTSGRLVPETEPSMPRQTGLGAWLEGWRTLQARPMLFSLTLASGIFAFTSGLFLVTLIEQVAHYADLSFASATATTLTTWLTPFAPKPPVINIPFLAIGMTLAALGVGLGLGVLFCGKSRIWPRWKPLPIAALVAVGIGIFLFGGFSSLYGIVIGSVALGMLGSVMAIPIEARLQEETPAPVLGRVFALRNFITTASFLAAMAINLDGRLLTALGPGQMQRALGILAVVLAALLWLPRRRGWSGFWRKD